MACGGAIIFAFSLGEIAACLRGESLIQRFGEVRIGSHAMILGGVVLLPAVLSQNPVLIVLVFLFFGFVSANFFLTVMRNAAEIDPEDAGVNIAGQYPVDGRTASLVLHWLATLLNTIQSPIRWHYWRLSGVVTEWVCTSC